MKTEQALTVALRLRPMNDAEYRAGAKIVAHAVDNQLVVLLDPNEDPDDILRANRSREKEYVFDCTFGEMSNQEDVYENTTKNLIPKILTGFNVTVFAYGPTGSGKTYTMLGTSRDPGIMVLTLNSLFEQLHATEEDNIFRVTMSYLEIYNEMIRDLLNPKSGILDLRDDSNGETMVAGLTEVEMTSTPEVMQLLNKGNLLRTCEPTAANHTSSRSHAILKVTVEQRSRTMDVSQEVRTGKLFMVDLAGSERAAMTKNRGQRMVEGAHINRSLLALGNCINALVMGKGQYVNYRDSKLTRLLKDSLGGNCQTVMIAHISPASRSFEESRNTLTYAERAKHIKTRVQQNVHAVSYHVTQYHRIIAELRWKISRLEAKQSRCQCQSLKGIVAVDELCHRLLAFLEEQKDIREDIYALKYSLVQNAIDAQRLVVAIGHWEATHHQSVQPSTQVLEENASNEKEELQIPSGSTTPVAIPAEPLEARRELTTLIADKQRMEAKQKRLERQLTEVDSQYDVILQELNKLGKMPQQQHVLQLSSQQLEVQSRALENGLAAAVHCLTTRHQDRYIQEMQHHCSEAFDIVEKQSAVMEAHGVSLPDIVSDELHQLKLRQSLLAAEIAASKHFLTKSTSVLPVITNISGKMETAGLLDGSKSNLLQEDGTTIDDDQATEIAADEHDTCLPEVIDSPLVVQGWSSTTTLTGITATGPAYSSGCRSIPVHKPIVASTSVTPTTCILPTTFPAFDDHGINTALVTTNSAVGKTSSTPCKFKSMPALQLEAMKSVSSTDEELETPTGTDHPLLHKIASNNPPLISISRCSTHRSRIKKCIDRLSQQAKTEPSMDTESDQTSSMTSLGTQTMRRRPQQTKNNPRRGSCLDLKPKLSQGTNNRLKEARLQMGIVEPPEENATTPRYRNHCITVSHASSHKAPLTRKAATGLGSSGPSPRRQSMQPAAKLRQSFNKRELIPHRVTAGESQVVKLPSPYLSSPIKTKKQLNHRPRPPRTRAH